MTGGVVMRPHFHSEEPAFFHVASAFPADTGDEVTLSPRQATLEQAREYARHNNGGVILAAYKDLHAEAVEVVLPSPHPAMAAYVTIFKRGGQS